MRIITSVPRCFVFGVPAPKWVGKMKKNFFEKKYLQTSPAEALLVASLSGIRLGSKRVVRDTENGWQVGLTPREWNRLRRRFRAFTYCDDKLVELDHKVEALLKR